MSKDMFSGDLSRRKVLRNSSLLGAGILSLNTLSIRGQADNNDRVERIGSYIHTNHTHVLRGAEPQREPRKYTIPRDVWAKHQAAEDAAVKLANRFHQKGIAVAVGSESENKTKLYIDFTRIKSLNKRGEMEVETPPGISLSELRSQAPERVSVKRDGVAHKFSVVTRETTVTDQDLNHYTGQYAPIPGGCQLTDKYNSGYGTLCTPVYSQEDNEHMLSTAGHMLDGKSNRYMYQPDYTDSNPDAVSEDIQANDKRDFALLRQPSSYKYALAGGSGEYDFTVNGIVAKDKLSDMAIGNGQLYMQGCTTGRYKRGVKEAYYLPTGELYQVKLDHDSQGGDSGGPYFQVDSNDNAQIAGCHAWGVSYAGTDEEDAKGNTMCYLEDVPDYYENFKI